MLCVENNKIVYQFVVGCEIVTTEGCEKKKNLMIEVLGSQSCHRSGNHGCVRVSGTWARKGAAVLTMLYTV